MKIKIILIGIILIVLLSGISILFPILFAKYSYKKLGSIFVNERIIDIYCDKKINVEIDKEAVRNDLIKIQYLFSMKFKHGYAIYICKDNYESKRLFPLFTTKSSGLAFSGYFVIINYMNMKEIGYSLDEIIRHESTHLLFSQNMDIFINIRMINNDRWFTEGTAVFAQGVDDSRFFKMLEELKNYEVIYNKDRSDIITSPRNNKIEYLIFGYTITYLDKQYGKEKLRELIKKMLTEYRDGNDIFFETYQNKFSVEIRNILSCNVLMN
jgi:hypothetical protein